MNHCSGTTSRRSSHNATTTKAPVISSTRPHSPSTMSTSSRRIGWVRASCNPAMRLLSTGRAARPATSPATPAEASRLVPICLTLGKVMRAQATPIRYTKVIKVRLITAVCVCKRRACRLSVAVVGLSSKTTATPAPINRRPSHVTEKIRPRAVAWRTAVTMRSPSGAASQTNCRARNTNSHVDGARVLSRKARMICGRREKRRAARLIISRRSTHRRRSQMPRARCRPTRFPVNE